MATSDCSTRILLIEDDSQDIDLIQELLLEINHFQVSIEYIKSLSDSLERLTQGKIDVVLLDLSLPDSQGLNTFRRVYAQCSNVPVIVLSGLEDEEVAVAALQEGAQDYLVKGQFDGNLLVRAIRYAIERQRLLLTLVQQTQALQTSEQQLRTIIAKNADSILIVDHNNVIRFVNPAAESLFTCKAEELQGEVFGFPLLVGETTELTIQRSCGETVAAEMQVVEVNWEGKTAYLASLRDITVRKQAEESLRRALTQEKELSELKSRIIATISHEYRTPLTTISSSAELLERYRQKWDDNKQNKHFQRIQSSVQHMIALINDVLFLNKAESDKLQFQPKPINLVAFFQEIIDEVQSTITNKHNLIFTHQAACTQTYFDPKLLRQILSNLLSNAVKYSPNGGKVQVKLTCEDKNIVFQVIDEGIGIPNVDKANLFKSFSRASNVGAIAGTGLGLSIVKRCVDLHDGEIAVHSEVGVGTTFSIRLPLVSNEQ